MLRFSRSHHTKTLQIIDREKARYALYISRAHFACSIPFRFSPKGPSSVPVLYELKVVKGVIFSRLCPGCLRTNPLVLRFASCFTNPHRFSPSNVTECGGRGDIYLFQEILPHAHDSAKKLLPYILYIPNPFPSCLLSPL